MEYKYNIGDVVKYTTIGSNRFEKFTIRERETRNGKNIYYNSTENNSFRTFLEEDDIIEVYPKVTLKQFVSSIIEYYTKHQDQGKSYVTYNGAFLNGTFDECENNGIKCVDLL